jgi:chromosome segregation ATPase
MAVSKEKTSLMSKPHADLLMKIDELNCMTATHQKTFEDLVKAVQVAENEKAGAKQSYNEQLDLGDADKMQECLDKIKQANERIKTLTAEMKGYSPKVMELHKAQAALVKQARELQKQSQELLKQARERQTTTESFDNSCLASAGNINNLELAISKATAKKSQD